MLVHLFNIITKRINKINLFYRSFKSTYPLKIIPTLTTYKLVIASRVNSIARLLI